MFFVNYNCMIVLICIKGKIDIGMKNVFYNKNKMCGIWRFEIWY